jgi:hypothetical protein
VFDPVAENLRQRSARLSLLLLPPLLIPNQTLKAANPVKSLNLKSRRLDFWFKLFFVEVLLARVA